MNNAIESEIPSIYLVLTNHLDIFNANITFTLVMHAKRTPILKFYHTFQTRRDSRHKCMHNAIILLIIFDKPFLIGWRLFIICNNITPYGFAIYLQTSAKCWCILLSACFGSRKEWANTCIHSWSLILPYTMCFCVWYGHGMISFI